MWIPKEENFLTIDLPGERLRARVDRIVDADTVIVQITSQPMAKSHNYRKDQIVAVRRHAGEFNEIWRVVEEQRPVVLPPPKPPEKKDAAPERKQPKRNQSEHKRNGGKRSSAASSRGSSSQQRASTSKSDGRPRA